MIEPKKYIKDAVGYPVPSDEEWVLKLDFNENLIGPSPKVIDAVKSIAEKDVKFYPVYSQLINKIAEFNNVSDNMVLPSNGADDAIKSIFDTFIDETSEVLTVKPSFFMPKVYAMTSGCMFTEVPYKEKWVFPTEDFISKINDKTKMIMITSPNSPTAEVINEADLRKIIEKAKDKVVLIDQTYANYAEKSYDHLLKEFENVVLVKSMSKDFAIAGLRLGYIIAQPYIIEFIRRTISPFNVNMAAVKAGIASIEDKTYFEKVKEEINKSKKYLVENLSKIAKKVYPSDANFFCVDFGEKATFVYKKWLKNKIKTKLYKNNDMLENFFRLTVPPLEGAKFLIEKLTPKEMLIFDMDGVLVDVTNSYRVAIQKTFEFFVKKELSLAEIQEAKNLGGLNNDWDLTEFLIKKHGVDVPKKEIIEKFQQIYWDNGNGLISTEKWLLEKEEIEKLAQKYDLAIFTGRPKQEAMFALKNKGVENLFEPIITMDDLSFDKQKPNPTGILEILKIAEPLKAYYIGDTPDDMKTAKFADVVGIGVLPPQDKSEDLKNRLKDNQAMIILENTKEVLKYLECE